jgi:putative transcriptional regulator
MSPERPARGRLLVATPSLGDPNFDRTVVLLLEHGADGALGVVLNRPGSPAMEVPLPDWRERAAPPAVVFTGGPVAPSAAVGLARTDRSEAVEGWAPVIDRTGTVDLGRHPDELGVAVEAVRVFAGYAGWGGGQLEGEIEAGAWFVVAAEPGDAFSDRPEQLWRLVLRRQAGRLAMFANAPMDPSVN